MVAAWPLYKHLCDAAPTSDKMNEMRSVVTVFVVLSVVSLAGSALADVGPSPACPPGTRKVYHQGYHCLLPGQSVTDTGPLPADVLQQPAEKPTETTTTTPAKPENPPTSNTPITPPPKKASGCTMAAQGDASTLLGAFMALGLLVFRRRRWRSADSNRDQLMASAL